MLLIMDTYIQMKLIINPASNGGVFAVCRYGLLLV